jgi:DNA-binding MarR family transcriptional regulator
MGYLHAIGEAKEPLAPGDLAARLDVTPATVTGALTALEEAGLVVRARHPDDRRGVLVSITAAGRKAQRQWAQLITNYVREALAPLSDKELEVLIGMLTRVAPPLHGPPKGFLQGARHDASTPRLGGKIPPG